MDLQLDNFEGYGLSTGSEIEQLTMLAKALEAGTTTNVSAIKGGQTLQPQSLDNILKMLTFNEKHMSLWRDVPKEKANSTLEEYSIQDSYGQEGGFVSQMQVPLEDDPGLRRAVAVMKYIRAVWRVSDVGMMVQNSPTTMEIKAKQAAVARVLRIVNTALYTGDSAMVPDQIDGFEKTIKANGSTAHVIDLRGNYPTQENFEQLTQALADNFTNNLDGCGLYCSIAGMTTIAQVMKQSTFGGAQRVIQGTVNAQGMVSMGFGVDTINTPMGRIIPKPDIFIGMEYEGKTVPKKKNFTSGAIEEGPTSDRAPLLPTLTSATPVAATVSGSLWKGTGNRVAGAYRYRVAARNNFGSSAASAASSTATVVADGAVDVVITPDVNSQFPASCFDVYSESAVGAGDYAYIGSIAANGNSAVTFRDLNTRIPGTTAMFLIDLTSVGEMQSFVMKQLAPIYSVEFAKTGMSRSGCVNLYVTPQYTAPLRYGMLSNVKVGTVTRSPLLPL